MESTQLHNKQPQTTLDHLVIGADTLAAGVDYVREVLGVDIPVGGTHINMGTHNHLMQLGQNCFLEVIAVAPDIPTPAHPRWYGLNDPYVCHQLKQQPALLTWVVNTQRIQQLSQNSAYDTGKPTLISRNQLQWLFSLPEDGRLLAGGMLPYLIEWLSDEHPALNMADCGCRLAGLEIHHPHPDWLQNALQSIQAEHLVEIHGLATQQAPYLLAQLDTPNGHATLKSL